MPVTCCVYLELQWLYWVTCLRRHSELVVGMAMGQLKVTELNHFTNKVAGNGVLYLHSNYTRASMSFLTQKTTANKQ